MDFAAFACKLFIYNNMTNDYEQINIIDSVGLPNNFLGEVKM